VLHVWRLLTLESYCGGSRPLPFAVELLESSVHHYHNISVSCTADYYIIIRNNCLCSAIKILVTLIAFSSLEKVNNVVVAVFNWWYHKQILLTFCGSIHAAVCSNFGCSVCVTCLWQSWRSNWISHGAIQQFADILPRYTRSLTNVQSTTEAYDLSVDRSAWWAVMMTER